MTILRYVLFTALLFAQSIASANDFYTHGSFPAPGSPATSAGMRAELDLITAGFDKLPALSGNASRAVVVNGAGTALGLTTGTMSLAGNFAISGAYATTLTVTGATTLTLPTTGTLSTLAGAESLSNKTIVAAIFSGTSVLTGASFTDGTFNSPTIANPVFSGTATGTYTLGGTPTIASPVFSGTATGTYTLGGTPTLNSPTITGGTITQVPITQNSQSANYTTVLADGGKHLLHPASDNNPRTFTIDSNANVAYPIGTTITIVNMVNTLTIAITSDTMTLIGAGTTGSRTLAANGMATLMKIGTTSWIISGGGLS